MAAIARCRGCGRTFKGARGLRSHQSRPFAAMACLKDPLRCECMTEDLGDGFGERVVTHSSGCVLHPDYDA